MDSAQDVIRAVVVDVEDDKYILKTADGVTYKIPTGTIPIQNGNIFPIDDNQNLLIYVSDSEEENELENTALGASATNTLMSVDDDSNHQEAVFEKSSAVWGEDQTKLLICLYQEYKPLVENNKIKSMKRMWEKISNRLEEYKYCNTAVQVESKLKSLERAFKNTMDNAKKTGRGRKTCPFEKELSAILVSRQSVFPPCVMDEEKTKSKSTLLQESNIETNEDDPEDSSRSGAPDTPIRKKSRKQEMKLLADAIENKTRTKTQLEQQKYDQRERLIQELQRKNDILEKLLQQ